MPHKTPEHLPSRLDSGDRTKLSRILRDAAASQAAPIPKLSDLSEDDGSIIDRVRSEFPLLQKKIGENRICYLDNAATTQKPFAVINAVASYYLRANANVHRSVHRLGEEATALYEGARAKVRAFIGANESMEVVFTRGTTEAINLVAESWAHTFLKPSDAILLSAMEHHSNIVPWQNVCEKRDILLQYIPLEDDGSIDLDALEERWDDRVRLLAIAHCSNVLGTINDVKRLSEIAHSHGALVLVDGAQSIPHTPIDLAAIGCDFFVFSGHKMYGPMGIGVLCAKKIILDAMPPWMRGGDMILRVEDYHSTWNEIPWKFEAGTPNVEAAVGLEAAITFMESVGYRWIEAYEAHLCLQAINQLKSIPGLTLHGNAPRRSAVLSFSIEKVHPHDLAQYLDTLGIAVRAGHHCAQVLMRILGVSATTRASFALYNSQDEVRALVQGIRSAIEFFA